jgi:hypothetical protein
MIVGISKDQKTVLRRIQMIYIFAVIAYVLSLLLLIRFFGAVRSWDDKIRSMHISKMRRFRKLSGQKAA